MQVGIIDVGLGNVGSVRNMFNRIRVRAELVQDPNNLVKFDRMVLPGVGHFDRAMKLLHEKDFVEPIKLFAASNKPILGICLGMQLLTDGSEEGEAQGLGLIPGRLLDFSKHIPKEANVPNIGWCRVKPISKSALFPIEKKERYYFVHKYFLPAENPKVLAVSKYEIDFGCVIGDGKVFGAQFHPEKSHRFGMDFFKRFSEL